MEADNKLWLPVDKEIWIPPSPPSDQKEVVPLRKRLSLKVPRVTGIKIRIPSIPLPSTTGGMPLLIQLFGILLISASVFVGLSRFSSQQTQQQEILLQQLISEQEKLARQNVGEQEKLIKQITTGQKSLLLQQASIVDQGHEQILSDYLNSMSTLLSQAASKKTGLDAFTKNLAQTKTLAVFSALKSDAPRLGIVVQFLHDSNLISSDPRNPTGHVVQLDNATLTSVNLSQANLPSANFDNATMANAILTNATLPSSTFRGTILTKANFTGADLQNVDFSGANLENANLTNANLKGTNLGSADIKNAILKGATF